MAKRKASSDRSATPDRKSSRRGSRSSSLPLHTGSTPPAIPKHELFVNHPKPNINLAIISSDSSVDVASMARLLHFQVVQVLGNESSRHMRLTSNNSFVGAVEMERTKQYIAELERAKAVRAGAPLHDDINQDRGNEDENAGGKGRKKGGSNNAAKRAGAAARKQQQQAEEELLAMSPEHLKELEEERQRLMDTYLKNYEFTSVIPNSVAEFDGQTQMLFIYELLGQEEVLTPQEDGSIGDVSDAFWRTIEAAAPPGIEEITVIWAVSDVRLLKALKESPNREPEGGATAESGPTAGVSGGAAVAAASPTASAAAATTSAGAAATSAPERHIHIRMMLYANDAQFTDPTLSAPNTGDNTKRASRFSMAKKGGGRKVGSQGSEGSRNSSRNSRGGKGSQKNANAPSDSAPANFFESGVVADDILFECQTFGEFIDKQMLLQKQKAELQKLLDSTKPPNSDCDPNLLSMLSQDEPGIRLTAVAPPEDVPNPLEAHLNKQKAIRPGTVAPVSGSAASGLTASKSLTALEMNPSMSSGRGSTAMTLTTEGQNAGGVGAPPVLASTAVVPPPEPIWSVIRAVQTGTNAVAEEDWINTCRRKGVCPIFELASIVSIYNHWRSQKKFTDLPASLRWQQDQRLQLGFTQGPKDSFRPYRYDVDDMKMFTPGVSQDELRARKEPVTEGGFQVYEREKLLGGEFIPYTALLALISQTSCNLTRAQPYQLLQLEDPEALPPMLDAVCQQQKSVASKHICPLFKVNAAEELAAIGDNRGTASVAVEIKPVQAVTEPREARDQPTPSPGLKGKDAKGKEAKKSPGKRPGTSKHESKEESMMAALPPPTPPRPTAWAFPMDHCHDEFQPEPSPQEVEWLVQQYTKKGLGRFFYSKRGCTASPAKITSKEATAGRDKMSQQAKSEILQAVHMMREFHGSRVGGQLLPQAEEMHQRVFLFRTCYGFLQHLNKCSFNAALEDPRSFLFSGLDANKYPLSSNYFWDKVPQDIVAKMTKPLTHQEEQLKLSVERNLTARERAHVIQRSLLVELARAVGLLPPCTKILDETPLNIEEVVTLSTALHRLSEFPLRFGQHIASIFSFASEELDKSHVESAMAVSYAAKHSMNAENVYPVRRAVRYLTSGVPIPPFRRKNLIWLFPVSGCLPVDQFIAWKRWVNRSSGSTEDSYGRGGPVTFASNPVFGEEELHKAPKKEEMSKHGKLATDFMEKLLSKVLDYNFYHTSKEELPASRGSVEKKPSSTVEHMSDMENTVNSQRGMDAGKLGNIAPEYLKNFQLGKDLYLATEGRQVLYPFCDAVVEIATTNYSRQCRFISTKEVTATLQYNIPLPITDGDMSELLYMLSKRSAPIEETAYLTVRFDDGLTVTIANRAKPPARLSHPRLSKTRTADGDPSVTSLTRNSMSVMSTSSKKGKEKKKREKRTTSKRRNSRNSVAEVEKPPENSQPDVTAPVRQLPPLCPPIAPNGDVRLWTAREELLVDESPAAATAGGAASTTTAGAGAAAQPAGAPALNGQHIFEEPLKRKSKIEPLDITIASSNFTFHNRERDGMLWFSYSLSQSSASKHIFSLPETIFCVHCNEGVMSKLEASLEREVRRSVEEATGVVVRYFESGMTQTLFPDGATLCRFKEVGTNPTGVPQRAVLLGEDQSSERFCETLTLTTGSVYVRSVYSNSGNRFFIDTDLCEEVSSSFTAIDTFRDQRIVYDATQHCHTMTREDGVTVVYYYTRNTVLEYAPAMADTIQTTKSSVPDDLHAMNGTTASTATPLVRSLTDKLRRMETWDGTLVSAELTQNGSIDDVPEVYARVTLHADGTTVTTFGENVDGLSGTCTNSKTLVSEVVDPGIAPSVTSLLNDARVVHAACQGPVKWCIESPRIPRIFLISVPDRLEQLTQTMHEWHMSFPRATPFSLADSIQGVVESEYDSFYLVFGDGSVLKRHLLSRPTRGTVVPFLETVISRPTDTAVRIIHDNGIAVVERAVDVKRNSENPASAAIGEGFAVFDLALGGFRLVDYLSHVTEVKNIYSPFGVSASLTPVSWEILLKELVHDTYSAHRLPKAQMERMKAKKEQDEQKERDARASGVCPPLMARMRELAEEFVVSNGLLKPDVLHTLEKFGLAAKGLTKDDLAKATSESQGSEGGLLSTTTGQIAPVFLCQRANGEVVQFLSEQAMERVVEEEGLSELNPDPVYLLRSIASGEPGVQQLSLFRVGSNERTGPPDHRSTTATLLAGARDHKNGSGATAACEPGSLRDAMERYHKLSSFYNGTSFAAHYHHADNPTFDYTIGDPSQYLGSFSRWQPRECQPPRRFLKPPVRRDKTKGGVVELHEDDTLLLQKSSHESVRTFLQFQPVSSTAANTVLNAELQRSRQLSDLTQYHQVMQGSFPEVPSAAMDEQKRLQQIYFSMRGSTR